MNVLTCHFYQGFSSSVINQADKIPVTHWKTWNTNNVLKKKNMSHSFVFCFPYHLLESTRALPFYICLFNCTLFSFVVNFALRFTYISNRSHDEISYMCVTSIDFASFYDFSIRFRNGSNSVVFFVFLLDYGTVPTVWYFLLLIWSPRFWSLTNVCSWIKIILTISCFISEFRIITTRSSIRCYNTQSNNIFRQVMWYHCDVGLSWSWSYCS